MKNRVLLTTVLLTFCLILTSHGKDNKSNVSRILKECNSNDASACSHLGSLYFFGAIDGRKNDVIANKYFIKACSGNDANGCYFIGMQYLNGRGIKKDLQKGIVNLNKSCNFKNTQACTELGNIYHEAQEFTKASEFYGRACKMNDAESCLILGFLYAQGKGVEQNPSIAKDFFGKACDLENDMGCESYRNTNNN